VAAMCAESFKTDLVGVAAMCAESHEPCHPAIGEGGQWQKLFSRLALGVKFS